LVLRSLGLCVGQNQMCQLCGWLKIVFKKVRWEKNKKHRVGLSVGLLAVPFEYVRYVGHLSKWFVFVLLFKFWSVCRLVNGRPTIGYNGIWLQVRWGIQRYLVCIKNLKIHKEKMIEKLLCPTCL